MRPRNSQLRDVQRRMAGICVVCERRLERHPAYWCDSTVHRVMSDAERLPAGMVAAVAAFVFTLGVLAATVGF